MSMASDGSIACPDCEVVCRDITALRGHAQGVHGGLEESRPEIDGTAACPYCNVGGCNWRKATREWYCTKCQSVVPRDAIVDRSPRTYSGAKPTSGAGSVLVDMSPAEFEQIINDGGDGDGE